LDFYRIVLIAHLFGLAFGMGGATTIDAIFLLASIRRRVTRELVEVVHAAAALVAAAMVILVVSGIAFFAVGTEATPKFWAKMVIVGVACLNGLAAHRVIFPIIAAGTAPGTGRLHLRPTHARLAAASAAVSGVSWAGALVLGAWHGLTVGMLPILAVYAIMLVGAILFSTILVAPRIFVLAPVGNNVQARTRRDLRLMPVSICFSIALGIADAALAVAGRLNRLRGWPGTDPFVNFPAPANTDWPDRNSLAGAYEVSFDTVVPVSGRAREVRGDGANASRPAFGGWTSHGFEPEPEAGWQ
jgi:hypothetical protein